MVFCTLLGMALLIFVMVRLLPGDFVDAMVGADSTISAEAKEALRASYGLSELLPLQFVRWMGQLARGDLGVSFRTGQPIAQILWSGLPVTLELAVLASVLSIVVAIPLGVLSATRHNSQVDVWARVAGLIGLSFPNFWLATVLLLATSLLLKWVPPVIWVPPTQNLGASLLQVLLPMLALSLQLIGGTRTHIIRRHVLPNITAPMIVQTSLSMSTAILSEAALSFLGLGTQPPNPSWGAMLSSSRKYMELSPMLAIIPGLAIMIVVLDFNFLGDGLRDALIHASRSNAMYRILIAECKQEVSSFNPAPSSYNDFEVAFGDAVLARGRAGVQSEIAGALGVFAARDDVEVIATYSAVPITSGGTLPAADFARIADELLGSIRAVPALDGVYLSLHGAMSAEGEDDPEGWLLAKVRNIIGEEIPLVASFDLHGIMTDRILEQCDAITIYHTYPHVDFVDTGERAARLLLRILDGQVRPITARVRIPALVRGNELITETGLFGGFIRRMQAAERGPNGLASGMFIGNPFTDVRDLRSNTVMITDNDAELAARVATEIAVDFWEVRAQLQQPLVSLQEAVQIACTHSGTTILVDAADATSSGASGDSNAILRALLGAGYAGRALIPIVDRPAVEAAFAAGVGATVQVTLGGTRDPGRFQPLPITARVHLLSEGRFLNESWGNEWYAGPTAVLLSGAFTLVVTSHPVHLFDRSLFLAHGQNPHNFDAVVVKSPHCQHHFYADWAARMVNVDAPGSTSANLPYLGHTRCQRPIFPLDAEVPFTPEVRLFQRPRYR